MDSTKMLLAVILGTAAGLAGYLAYTRSGAMAATLVVFTVALVLYLFSSKKQAWDSLSMLKEPFWTAILGFLIGFTYSAFKSRKMSSSLVFAFGTGLLGGALGILFSFYWSIGS